MSIPPTSAADSADNADTTQAASEGRPLDLRRIRQFVVLAETLNFRRAAQRLHIAQPPLSVSIQKLEAELGTRLFERGGAAGVCLTPSGQAALAQARRLLQHNAQFIAAAQAAASGEAGALRVGFVGSSTHGVLQRIVRSFRAGHPGVELILQEATSIGIVQRVEEGSLDIGLVRTPLLQATQARLQPLLSEPFVAALPRGHALEHQARLTLQALAGESFVFYKRTNAAGLHAMALLACQQAGFMPRITQEATQVQTVLSLVDSGLGIALVPSVVQYSAYPHVAYRPLSGLSPSLDLGLALLSSEAPIPSARRFVQVAQACFAKPGT